MDRCRLVETTYRLAILHYKALKMVQWEGLKESLHGKFKRTQENDTDLRPFWPCF
jgi:hypothetical protein